MAYRFVSLINSARTHPDRTAANLYKDLSENYNGNQLKAYNKSIDTFEGVKALDQLYQYMKSLKPTGYLIQSSSLNKAAIQIAKQKGLKGQVTNEKPKLIYQKVQKESKIQGKVGQLICLNTQTSEQALAYFLIDDGLMSRKRRRMLLDSSYKYIGIGSSQHSTFGSITVILLAENVIQ